MRTPVIAGNWKMNKTLYESVLFVRAIRPLVTQYRSLDIVVFPTFVALNLVSEALKGSNIAVGAQNMHWEDSGAYTGEIAPSMLEGIAEYVLIGHSERRSFFAETDAAVNKKLKAAFASGLSPIVCVGEDLQQNESGVTGSWVGQQVRSAFDGFTAEQAAAVIVAYEPVWAIGTGKTATPELANKVCGSIVRGTLARMFGEHTAQKIRVLYGGSTNEKNLASFMAMPDIDGALVGGASLKVDPFLEMIDIAAKRYDY